MARMGEKYGKLLVEKYFKRIERLDDLRTSVRITTDLRETVCGLD